MTNDAYIFLQRAFAKIS